MKYFDKKSAMKACYYLSSIDGVISAEELQKLDEIGKEIDPELYDTYKESLLKEISQAIEAGVNEEDYSEIIQERIDAVVDETEITERISTRLVIWNMMVLAYSDERYDEPERKLIRHLSRLTGVENPVLLEMEQIILAYRDVLTELEWLEQSTKPYNQIRPHVEEIEKRKENLLRNATELIADEILAPIPEELLKAKKKQEQKEAFEGTVRDVTGAVQKTASDVTGAVSKTANDVAAGAKKGVGKVLRLFGDKSKKTSENVKEKEGGEE